MVRHRRRRCPITPPRRPRCHHLDRCGFRSLHGRRSRKRGAGPISTVLRRQSTGLRRHARRRRHLSVHLWHIDRPAPVAPAATFANKMVSTSTTTIAPRCHHLDRCGFRSLHGRRSRKRGAGPISTVLRRQSTGLRRHARRRRHLSVHLWHIDRPAPVAPAATFANKMVNTSTTTIASTTTTIASTTASTAALCAISST